MVSRRGAPDSPSAITSVVSQDSGVADISGAFEAVARASAEVRERMQPILNQNAARRGAASAAEGDFRQRALLTAQDQYFNHAVQTSFLAKAANDIDLRVREIEIAHPPDGDVKDLGKAFDDAKNAFLAGSRPEYAMAIGGQFDKAKTQSVMRVAEQQRDRAVKSGLEALKFRVATIDDQLEEASDARRRCRSFWSSAIA
jgi:hypothetical protein